MELIDLISFDMVSSFVYPIIAGYCPPLSNKWLFTEEFYREEKWWVMFNWANKMYSSLMINNITTTNYHRNWYKVHEMMTNYIKDFNISTFATYQKEDFLLVFSVFYSYPITCEKYLYYHIWEINCTSSFLLWQILITCLIPSWLLISYLNIM